ncbi:MAG: ABC transporter substrate-binding protein [Salinisphaeraceae bacterium]|nr:ABC transporter substrate-binding protein [Salinisphaeraceae bacterium]
MRARPFGLPFLLALLLISLSCVTGPAQAQQDQNLDVGTKLAPPFVIKNDDGELEGISIELWQRLSERLGLASQFQQRDSVKALVGGVASGEMDAAVAAITVTAPREEQLDFSHPFYSTGLSIAVSEQGSPVWSAMKRFFSWEFFTALLALGAVLLGVGVAIWLAERRGNPEEFGGSTTQGLGSGFWWAAVTMTTVGYGDKSPRTFAGRIVGLVWMFAAIIIISGFTAAIATSLTVSQLESTVQGVDDLPKVRVATVDGSVSSEFLKARGIGFEATNTLEDSLQALASGSVDAVVYDRPLLLYLSNQEYPKRTRVLAEEFERQDYAIALPSGSPRREAMNRELLDIINSDEWTDILERYLGDQP